MEKHNPRCIEMAEVLVREECADQLSDVYMGIEQAEAEQAWVSDWALTWLSDGTTSCRCNY